MRGRTAGGGARPRRSIPFVEQMSANDCGIACLAMVLGWHGQRVKLEELRKLAGTGRDGASVFSLIQAGEARGLIGRGLKARTIEDLQQVGRGAILFWRFQHFVVLDRFAGGRVHLLDPAVGHCVYSLEDARRRFTGLVLVFEPGEGFERGGERLPGVLARAARRLKGHWATIRRGLAVSGLLQILGMALPLLVGTIVDQVVPTYDGGLLLLTALLTALITLFFFLSTFLRTRVLLELQTNLDIDLTRRFMHRLVSLPLAFFHQRTAGDILMRLNSNAFIREVLGPGAVSTLIDGILVASYLVLMFLAEWRLAAVVLFLGSIRVGLFLATRHKLSELSSALVLKRATLEGYQVQVLSGVGDMKSAGAEEPLLREWSRLFADVVNTNLRRERTLGTMTALQGAITFSAPVVVVILGVFRIFQGGSSLGEVVAFSALAGGFLAPLSELVSTANRLQLLESHLERVEDVLAEAPEQSTERPCLQPTIEGNLRCEEVGFRYDPGSPLVLDAVSLEVPAVSSLAIVGRSGSGKTTLARLLTRLYTPTEGRVLVDGVDLSECDVRHVRRRFASVSQRPHFFGMSLRRNIALFDPETSFDEIVAAARLAEIHRDITEMPMGYETTLWDGAHSLSWGQAQRLALARALVQKPKILLLDEATSALDSETEKKIFDNLAPIRCTVILIAHRLSTVLQADRIVMLDDGRIKETGDHATLVARRGAYWELVRDQLNGSDAEVRTPV